jgi:hypothetical protein
MADPRVPSGPGGELELPCGETMAVADLDMGLRELACDCGDDHAVVMDVHPLARFVPEDTVGVLRQTVETADDYDEFSTAHVMGMVREEFPGTVAEADVSDDGTVGYALLWVAEFDARRLHEVVVELVVDLMDHAVSHAEDDAQRSEFEAQLQDFDIEAFVTRYREARDFESEHDSAV